MAKTITILHLDDETSAWLDEEARRRGMDVERVVIELIRQGAETGQKEALPTYHDLDSLAGTWTEEEAAEFFDATVEFGKVDGKLWK